MGGDLHRCLTGAAAVAQPAYLKSVVTGWRALHCLPALQTNYSDVSLSRSGIGGGCPVKSIDMTPVERCMNSLEYFHGRTYLSAATWFNSCGNYVIMLCLVITEVWEI